MKEERGRYIIVWFQNEQVTRAKLQTKSGRNSSIYRRLSFPNRSVTVSNLFSMNSWLKVRKKRQLEHLILRRMRR
jgi:hypothetical protein